MRAREGCPGDTRGGSARAGRVPVPHRHGPSAPRSSLPPPCTPPGDPGRSDSPAEGKPQTSESRRLASHSRGSPGCLRSPSAIVSLRNFCRNPSLSPTPAPTNGSITPGAAATLSLRVAALTAPDTFSQPEALPEANRIPPPRPEQALLPRLSRQVGEAAERRRAWLRRGCPGPGGAARAAGSGTAEPRAAAGGAAARRARCGAVRQRGPRLRRHHRSPPLSAALLPAPGGRYRELRVDSAPFVSASPRRGFSSRWVRERGGKSLPSLLPAFGTAQPLPLP